MDMERLTPQPTVALEQVPINLSKEEIDPTAEAFFDQSAPMSSVEQRQAFHCIKIRIDENKVGLLFIDAPVGTGKTFLIAFVRK